jgi:hypothetical protein
MKKHSPAWAAETTKGVILWQQGPNTVILFLPKTGCVAPGSKGND